ncbi:DUF2919 domain-containing protein [Siccibacter turicensis]|uniref:DUF2919 domain-containing protein n=1 Tax=Siccibacter turicensis TaxID=357233 RepID=UPI003F569590
MYLPSDYDDAGRLKVPMLFWAVLVLQARTWVLFVIAGASREQGSTLLALFYPDRDAFWPGLCVGLPAALAFLLSGKRHQWPRLWKAWRGVLVATQLWLILWQALLWWQGEAVTGMTLALLIADLYALWWLLTSPRLRACFHGETL